MANEILRSIPKLDLLLGRAAMLNMKERFHPAIVKLCAQQYLDELRQAVLAGRIGSIPAVAEIETEIINRLESEDYFHLKHLINATGVVLHTNLGRAPFGEEMARHVAKVAQGYSNLEYDLAEGRRGSRYSHVEKLICELTGAESAMVVNNNAGAVFLMLNTLAKGKKVAISRGELVEIGGSFRVPEIMRESGAELCEIGTTNKTHAKDYIRAMDELGAEVLLKVHTSNFKMYGFTQEVLPKELSQIARERDGILLHDLGSGFMFAPEALGLREGHAVWSSIREGADVVCFSADKLLGAAQGGIIIGKKKYIEKIKQNQLTRMLRIDKLSLAALEITLQYCHDTSLAAEKIPVISMLTMTEDKCREKAEKLMHLIESRIDGCITRLMPVQDEPGGGSLPGLMLDGYAVAVKLPGISPERAEHMLHCRSVPVIARISKDSLVFSVRTIFENEYEEIAEALEELIRTVRGKRK